MPALHAVRAIWHEGLTCFCPTCHGKNGGWEGFCGRTIRDQVGYDGLWSVICSCDHRVPSFPDLELSRKDKFLLRPFLSHGWSRRSKWRLKLGAKYSVIFGRYLAIVPARVRPLLYRFLSALPSSICERCLIDYLKEVGRRALSSLIQSFDANLLYFLDLKVLAGYDTELNRDDPFSNYDKFFGTRSEGDESLYSYIDAVVSRVVSRPVGFSFEEFVSFRDAWATPGSSVGGTTTKVVFTDRSGCRSLNLKNKWFATLDMSDEEICSWALTRDVVVKPFVKPDEPAACRTVQGYDTRSIIRCSYIEQGIGELNGLGAWTSVGMSEANKAVLRSHLMSKDGLVRLCTDQSNFDVNQHKNWIVYAVKSLFTRLASGQRESYKQVCDAEIDSLDQVYLYYSGNKLKWQKGILSGYKFTALLDSILNAAATELVLARLSASPVFSFYQGDDCIVKLSRPVSLDDLANEYVKLGLVVNPQKTWAGTTNSEYLHELYVPGSGVFGFPARVARAMIWRKPGLAANPSREQDIRSYLDLLLKGFRRGLLVLPVVRRVLREFAFPGPQLEEYINTPSWFGGFGICGPGRRCLELHTTVKRSFKVAISKKPRLPVPDDVADTALRLRLKGTIPLPGHRVSGRLISVARPPQLLRQVLSDSAAIEPVRVDWVVDDLRFHPNAYARKLRLEHKYVTRARIECQDLPNKLPQGANPTRVYRLTRTWLDSKPRLDSSHTCAESYIDVKQWANAVWVGVVAYWSLIGPIAIGARVLDLVTVLHSLKVACDEMVRDRQYRSAPLRI